MTATSMRPGARLEWVPGSDWYELTVDGTTYWLTEAQVTAWHNEILALLDGEGWSR